MKEDLARDYLEKSEFTPMQAEALARLLADVATKEDVRHAEGGLRSETHEMGVSLRSEMREMGVSLRSEMREMETRRRSEMNEMETRLRSEMHEMEARLRAEIQRSMDAARVERAELKADLEAAIARSQTEMMRWGIAMIVAMSSIFTLLDIFID